MFGNPSVDFCLWSNKIVQNSLLLRLYCVLLPGFAASSSYLRLCLLLFCDINTFLTSWKDKCDFFFATKGRNYEIMQVRLCIFCVKICNICGNKMCDYVDLDWLCVELCNCLITFCRGNETYLGKFRAQRRPRFDGKEWYLQGKSERGEGREGALRKNFPSRCHNRSRLLHSIKFAVCCCCCSSEVFLFQPSQIPRQKGARAAL